VAGEEHALDRGALRGEPALEFGAPCGDARRFGRDLLAFGLQRGKRAVRLGDGALGSPQRVARFLAGFLLVAQLPVERFDARPQGFQVIVLARSESIDRNYGDQESASFCQAFAFPWLATAAMRFSTSAGSPR
jgi:hypothetical protein